MHRESFIFAAIGVGFVCVGAFALIAPSTGEKEAILAAGPTTMALGFECDKLPSPCAVGSAFLERNCFIGEYLPVVVS